MSYLSQNKDAPLWVRPDICIYGFNSYIWLDPWNASKIYDLAFSYSLLKQFKSLFFWILLAKPGPCHDPNNPCIR